MTEDELREIERRFNEAQETNTAFDLYFERHGLQDIPALIAEVRRLQQPNTTEMEFDTDTGEGILRQTYEYRLDATKKEWRRVRPAATGALE